VAGAFFELYARFLPAKRKRGEEKQNAKAALKKMLGDITKLRSIMGGGGNHGEPQRLRFRSRLSN